MIVRRKRFHTGEYALAWVFLAAAIIGVIGTSSLAWSAASASRRVLVAPTTEQYRAAASAAMAPFLSQAKSMSAGDFEAADAASFRVIVADVQAKMLALRVPADERDAHLAFVLLLDRWKNAFDAGAPERQLAIAKMSDALAAYSWIDALAAPTARPL